MSGDIPDDIYLRKIEMTNFDEDPMMHENYSRRQLADFRPDEAVLASDLPRYNNFSDERISLRTCGARSEVDPWLPDGTFLDHEFTQRDPRGVYNEPNFNQFRKETEARMAYINFGNDSDYSVVESAINPAKMRELIRSNQQEFADRFLNFDESFDARATAGTVPVARGSQVLLYEQSGVTLNIAEATARTRQDFTDRASNAIEGLLRWTTPDHRIKTSKYGDIRPMIDVNSVAWGASRAADLDHQRSAQFQDKIINRKLAHLITDIEGIQATRQVVAQGTDYGESRVRQNRNHRKLDPDDLYKLIAISMQSGSAAEVFDPESGRVDGATMRRGAPLISDQRVALSSAMVNVDMAESMRMVNKPGGRAHTPEELSEIRETVVASACSAALPTGEQEARGAPVLSRRLHREAFDTRHIEESRTVKSYAGVTPVAVNNLLSEINPLKSQSMTLGNRRRNTTAKNITTESTVNDVNMDEFAVNPDPRQKIKPEATRQIMSQTGIAFDKSDGIKKVKSLMDIVLKR
jgi:hypothetical protein